MMWVIFIKILRNTVQIKNVKYQIFFYDMIANMLNDKKVNPIVTELFIKGRKLKISLVFITQSYFVSPKISD